MHAWGRSNLLTETHTFMLLTDSSLVVIKPCVWPTYRQPPGRSCTFWHTELKSRPASASEWLRCRILQTPSSSGEPATKTMNSDVQQWTWLDHWLPKVMWWATVQSVSTCQGHSEEEQLSPAKLLRSLLVNLSFHWLKVLTLPQGKLTERTKPKDYFLSFVNQRSVPLSLSGMKDGSVSGSDWQQLPWQITCRLTLFLVHRIEPPSLCTGALVKCVTWFTELGAAFARFHGAQGLVCEQEGKVAAVTEELIIQNEDASGSFLPFSQWTPVKPDLQTQS